MDDQREVFRSNNIMILVPGLFFSVALILRGRGDLYVLMWFLLAIGLVTTIAVVSSFTTLIIAEREIKIKNLRKGKVIQIDEIAQYTKKVSTSKGIESVVWKLSLTNGKVIDISSDLFKEKEQLKKSVDEFLKRVPNK